MNKFFDYDYLHIEDGLVDTNSPTLAPFEAIFRFLKHCDKNMKDGLRLRLNLNTSIDLTLPEDPSALTLIWHQTGSDFPEDEIKKIIGDMERISVLEQYYSAYHYTVIIARQDNVVRVFWKGTLMNQASILVRAALAFKTFFPSAFNGKPTDWAPEHEAAFIAADKDNSLDKAWAIIEPFYMEYKKAQWNTNLKNLFINTYGDQIEAEERQRDDDYKRIRDCQKSIAEYMKRIAERNIRICGLKANNSSEKNYNDFIEYLQTIGADIVDYADNGRDFTIRFKGFADNYDHDLAADVIPSKSSYLYSDFDSDDAEKLRKLYTEVFVNEKYKLLITSNINILPRDYSFRFIQPNPGTATDIDGLEYLQNPHLRHHNCYGDNSTDIYEGLQSFDYYTVAMYLNACNSNLSFGDSTVMEEMGHDLLRNKNKKMFFCPEDGRYYSFAEIVKEEKDGTGTDDPDGSETAE